MRSRREELGLSQEKVGLQIGIDESSSRARISRYEIGTYEPPVETARLIAKALGAPLVYLYCERMWQRYSKSLPPSQQASARLLCLSGCSA